MFKELVLKPFEEPDPLIQAWVDHVKNKDFRYHRETILERGRTNFEENFEGLTPKDKVLIYCLYYMPMHLFSSYHIFTKYLPPVNDKVVFIDFGCGPLTSGIAFWASFAEHHDITVTYIGIDSSQSMLDKLIEINRRGPHGGERFFTSGFATSNYKQLHERLDGYITIGDQTQIIFNFCYFLASKTVDISYLSNCLAQIMAKYNQHKMYMVYQNPSIQNSGVSPQSSFLHKNWESLKSNLPPTWQITYSSHGEQFRFDSLVDGSLLDRAVHFEILSNMPNADIPIVDIPF